VRARSVPLTLKLRGAIKPARQSWRAARRHDSRVKFGRPQISTTKEQSVKDALARGVGVRAAARAGGVGVATASRIRDAVPLAICCDDFG
jgi:hypothetical protein